MAPFVVAFDFEAAGGIPKKHAFTQLGAVVVDLENDRVISEFNMYANMQWYDWEERCVKEFWEKFPERYAQTKKECEQAPLGPYEVVEQFVKWVQETCKDMDDVYLLTDNAGFDAGMLRYFSEHQDILYIFGEYRPIVESSRYYSGLSRKRVTVETLNVSSKKQAMESLNADRKIAALQEIPPIEDFSVQHDHHPVNDAKVIAWTWAHFQRHIGNTKAKDAVVTYQYKHVEKEKEKEKEHEVEAST